MPKGNSSTDTTKKEQTKQQPKKEKEKEPEELEGWEQDNAALFGVASEEDVSDYEIDELGFADDEDSEDEDAGPLINAPRPPAPVHLGNAATLTQRLDQLQQTQTQPLANGNSPLPQDYNRPEIKGRGRGAKLLQFATNMARQEAFGNLAKPIKSGPKMGQLPDVIARNVVTEKSQQRVNELRELGVAAEVNLTNSNGDRLNGNFFSAKGHNLKDNGNAPDTNKPVVLLLSGSAGSAEDYGLEISEFYRSNGANVLSVNYRGFGGSEGEPTEKGLCEDAQDMYEYLLKQGFAPDKISVHGFSLGGAVAAQLEKNNVSNPPFAGMIADRAMTSTYDAANTDIWSPLAWLGAKATGAFDSKDAFLEHGQDIDHVAINDEENLGPAAKKLREDLTGKYQNKTGNVTGGSTYSEHLDSQAMLEHHADRLRDVAFGGNYDAAIHNTSDDIDQLRQLDEEVNFLYQQSLELDNQASLMIRKPVRSQIELLLRSIHKDLEPIFHAVDQTNLLKKAPKSGKTYDFAKTFVRQAKTSLERTLDKLDNNPDSEWTAPDDQAVQAEVTTQEQSIQSAVTGKMKKEEIARIASATSKTISNKHTKAFKTVVRRMQELSRDLNSGQLAARDMMQKLQSIESAANFTLNGLEQEYGSNIKGDTNQRIKTEAKGIIDFVREQRRDYECALVIDDLRENGVERPLSQHVLRVLQNVGSELEGSATKYQMAHQKWLEENSQQPFGVGAKAKADFDSVVDELKNVKLTAAAALKGGTKNGEYWFFSKMADGYPLVITESALVAKAKRCADTGVSPVNGQFKKQTKWGKKYFSYVPSGGAVSEADMLSGLTATGWNVANLTPGDTLKRVSKI